MARTKTVIFDIYNTLLENDTDEEREDTYAFLSRWLSYHGADIGPGKLRSVYLDLCAKEIGKSTDSDPDLDIGRVFSGIIARYGGPVSPPHALVSEMALLFRILTTNKLSPFPGVMEMLKALKGKVKLGVASNAQRLFTIPELGKFGMMELFDALVLSSDVGVCKPNPKIFLAALDALSADPETTIFVGDNPTADIAGARNFGMKTIWINREGCPAPGIEPDLEVRDHPSLSKILLSQCG